MRSILFGAVLATALAWLALELSAITGFHPAINLVTLSIGLIVAIDVVARRRKPATSLVEQEASERGCRSEQRHHDG